ncbi:hypothetical protein LPJ66_004383 [Kickxella alabastrina]|uniref:Uncharacterized protein n=1 Tax=Kickxella alabastrina TaxID=61397 RepID=A0ACC1ILR3_9FUNG|nr:hypothetical protein LPJ66_004383 [Kickxella alabastrina]
MELRNRRLSLEELDEQTNSDKQPTSMNSNDSNRSNDDSSNNGDRDGDGDEDEEMEDMGGFLGDFEEICEDEDVERFISQNHTPAVSTRHSPEICDKAESSDEEDIFESIPDQEDVVMESATVEPVAPETIAVEKPSEEQVMVAAAVEPAADVQMTEPAAEPQAIEEVVPEIAEVTDVAEIAKSAKTAWLVSESIKQKYRELEDRFRDQFVPKLGKGQFFDPETYRKYTVIGNVAEASMAAPIVLQPQQQQTQQQPRQQTQQQTQQQSQQQHTQQPQPQHQHQQQKPSSLRSGALVQTDPPVSTRTRSTKASDQDDVVGALLGAMQPASKKPSPHTDALQATQATIPTDMLAAMAALDGPAPADAPTQPAQPKPDPTPHVTAKDLAAHLPRGYAGPFSQLTLAEHQRCQFLGSRGVKALGAREQAEFMRLRGRVEAEQKEFRRLLQEKTTESLRDVSPELLAQCRGWLEKQRREALGAYAPMYMPTRVMAIRPITSGHVPLEYRDTLLQCGVCHGVREVAHGGRVQQQQAGEVAMGGGRPVMTKDPHVRRLAEQARADVALSDSALLALLTLPLAYHRDLLIPLEVAMVGDRRLAVVDRPLVPGRAWTPRKLRQMYCDAAVRSQMLDRTQTLALGRGSGGGTEPGPGPGPGPGLDTVGAAANASYTVWAFGATRLLVRCGIDGFSQGESGGEGQGEGGSGETRVTVTLGTKLEHHVPATNPEAGLAAGGSGMALEEVTETERLSWWLSAWLRGSPSQLWVTHLDRASQAVRTSKVTAADMFPADAPQPSMHALRNVLAEIQRLPVGRYVLEHVRGAWDATILRAVDRATSGATATATATAATAAAVGAGALGVRPSGAVMDLAKELELEVEVELGAAGFALGEVANDYVPPIWLGAPPMPPWTYPPPEVLALQKQKQKQNGAGAGAGAGTATGTGAGPKKGKKANKRKRARHN